MSTPVYFQTPLVKNRPLARKDAQGDIIPSSYGDNAFRGEYDVNDNLIYKGIARPGSAEGSLVWQISKLAYDADDNLTSIKWPQDALTHASNDYQFSWTDRATYTYS